MNELAARFFILILSGSHISFVPFILLIRILVFVLLGPLILLLAAACFAHILFALALPLLSLFFRTPHILRVLGFTRCIHGRTIIIGDMLALSLHLLICFVALLGILRSGHVLRRWFFTCLLLTLLLHGRLVAFVLVCRADGLI